MKLNLNNLDELAWEKMDGMLPCIVQDAYSGSVQMLGYMNRDAIVKTLETGAIFSKKTTHHSLAKRLLLKSSFSKTLISGI